MTTTEAQPGTQIDLWERAYSQLGPEVQEKWALQQVKTIFQTVGKDLTPAEFQMGMAIAAKYDLDPLLKEIWFAKGKSKNGQPGKLLIMVGRDGLLRNARRDPDFLGFDTDVVRANDKFKVKRLADGQRQIEHEYEGGATARGDILGAWAQVAMRGKGTVYFFAPWEEYVPGNLDSRSPWYTQPSVMIQKCALSLCLRLAFNLSGVVGEDEGAKAWEAMTVDSAPPALDVDMLKQVVPEGMWDQFRAAYDRAQELRPGMVTIAAAQMSLTGQDEDTVAAYIARMAADNEAAAARADAPVEEPVVDAEVVHEAGQALNDGPAELAERRQVLERRLSDLYDRREEEGTEDVAESVQLDEEIADVEQQLLAAGGSIPGSEA